MGADHLELWVIPRRPGPALLGDPERLARAAGLGALRFGAQVELGQLIASETDGAVELDAAVLILRHEPQTHSEATPEAVLRGSELQKGLHSPDPQRPEAKLRYDPAKARWLRLDGGDAEAPVDEETFASMTGLDPERWREQLAVELLPPDYAREAAPLNRARMELDPGGDARRFRAFSIALLLSLAALASYFALQR